MALQLLKQRLTIIGSHPCTKNEKVTNTVSVAPEETDCLGKIYTALQTLAVPALEGNRRTWRGVFAFLALCCGSPQLQKQQWFLLSCRASRTCGSLLLITAGNAWNSEKGGWKPYQLGLKEGSRSQNLRPRVSSEFKGTCASLPACAV